MTVALVARTAEVSGGDARSVADLLGVAADPLGVVWHSEALSLAGVGEAVRIELPGGLADRAHVERARAALATITVDDALGRPGTGPVAVGALPFDPALPGHLVVPRTMWGRDRDGCWVTVVAEAGSAPDPMPAPGTGARPPDGFTLSSPLSHTDWEGLIRDAVTRIRAGALDKVVLARKVDVRANRPLSTADVVSRLVALYPACMTFAVEGFVGASPELLVSRRGRTVRSTPLAGTVARSGDTAADEALVAGLLASPKQRWEHQLVVDALSASLRPHCESLDVLDRPAVLGLRNVSHLATTISGVLAADDRGDVPTALELVANVHPTPAVGGTPTKAAVAHLHAVEGFDRGRYAGPVGWVDRRGDGDWALGIRSAVIDGDRASMYAGVGVVAASDPAAELAETQLKLQALLAALVRP